MPHITNTISLILAGVLASAQSLVLGTALPQVQGETLEGKPLVLPDAARAEKPRS